MGYYFLWVLLFSCVIFYAVADRIRDDWRLGLAVIAVLLGVTIAYRELFDFGLPFNLNLCPMAAVFMITGMYLARFDLIGKIESAGLRDRGFWIAFAASTVCVMAIVYILPPSIDFEYMDFGKYGDGPPYRTLPRACWPSSCSCASSACCRCSRSYPGCSWISGSTRWAS